MRLTEARVLVFDTETTGIDVENDRVIELGAAYFEGGQRTGLRRMLVNPGVPIPPEASAIHGLSDEDVKDAATFADVGARFASHLDGSALRGAPPVLCGYNAQRYDAPILNAEMARAGLPTRLDPAKVLDPFRFAAWHLRGLSSRKLGVVCAHLGVSLGRAHSAAADAAATGEVLFAMVARGFIPDDVDAAMAEQVRLAAALDGEWDRWTYWLYADRADGTIRLGAGKHAGVALHQADRDYLHYLVSNIPDLPTEVRARFEETLAGPAPG